jgi:hypothetical protein
MTFQMILCALDYASTRESIFYVPMPCYPIKYVPCYLSMFDLLNQAPRTRGLSVPNHGEVTFITNFEVALVVAIGMAYSLAQ